MLRIGAGWKQTAKNGNEYISAKITLMGRDFDIAIFPSKTRKTDKSPSYAVFLAKYYKKLYKKGE